MIKIQAQGLGKKYGNNRLFKNLDFTFEQPNAYAITGFNGSGKSTLLLCLAGLVTPTEGHLTWTGTSSDKTITEQFKHFSFCSPALELFEELTLKEHLQHHKSFVKTFDLDKAMGQLETFGLHKALNKNIRSFSSGMKQRLKLIMAFNNDMPVLLLDEPCSNLDETGINLYKDLLRSVVGKKMVVVATNQLNVEFPTDGITLNLQDLNKP